MNIGAMDREITIEQLAEAGDAEGGFTKDWTTFVTVWAERRPNRGGEREAGGQTMETRTAVFRCRYGDTDGVTEKMRIVDEGANWDIVRIEEAGFRQFRDITARMGRAD